MTEENNTPQRRKLGEGVITIVDRLIDELAGPVRRTRQEAASTLAEMAREHADRLEPDVERVTEALSTPCTAPRRRRAGRRSMPCGGRHVPPGSWPRRPMRAPRPRCSTRTQSRALSTPSACSRAWGASSPELSDKVWPLLDEAIQCFHGDLGTAICSTACLSLPGRIDADASKQALVERISFDVRWPRLCQDPLGKDCRRRGGRQVAFVSVA